MNRVHFLVPGDVETRTGGYLYDRRIMAGLTTLGWRVDLHRLDASFPAPTPAALAEADAVLAALPDRMRVVVDGLALGAMPEIAARHRDRLQLVALVHHPLALETGLDEATCRRLYASERESLRHVRRVIVTSPSTARALADYDLTPEQCAVVLPGTDPAPLAEGSGGGEWVLLCVASLTPRKGHALLFRALARLESLAWRLRCVGGADLDSVTAAGLRTLAAELGLAERVEFLGPLEEAALAAEYRRADLFVLPSYHEGYGMALAEALARGLPIVSTTAGAIPDTVPTDAALLVPPGDAAALTEALARVMTEPGLRERLAAGARVARENLPDWPTACARFTATLEAVPT
ncbi:MAG: glycosyltransferase family 4 protein [Candidatus Contendobacter sp.]|nr:glycosyltransferase family 4 protein [Candidatus Contendobacter sp.]MDG4556761.1 glycosyltransferase family 4 protein [Candidatus Contendobacter sp.]